VCAQETFSSLFKAQQQDESLLLQVNINSNRIIIRTMKICVEPMQFIFMIKLHNFIYASVGLLIGLLNMLPSTAGHLLLENSMLLNENTTLVHPTLNLTQNASVVTEQDLDKEPWWCQCSAELEEVVVSV